MALGLSGLAAASTAWGQGAAKAKVEDPAEQAVIEQVQARATRAGLGRFGTSRSEHFLSLGDAPARVREDALAICESLAKDFLAHFRERGFKVAFPEHRMTVVTLKDTASFGAYVGEDPDEIERLNVGGQYELDSNQLVIFDLRSRRADLNAEAERLNTLALVHETIHLLCFNAGLLDRGADVPVAISEGLATYGELWRPPRDPKRFGAINEPRLRGLANARNAQLAWIPIAQLIADDGLFRKPETTDLAYAEAWLLVNYLLKTPAQLPKFQAYLAGLPKLVDAKKRVEYTEARLGSLEALNQGVRRYRQRLPRR